MAKKAEDTKDKKEKKVIRKTYTVLKKQNFGWGDVEPGKKVELANKAAQIYLSKKIIK